MLMYTMFGIHEAIFAPRSTTAEPGKTSTCKTSPPSFDLTYIEEGSWACVLQTLEVPYAAPTPMTISYCINLKRRTCLCYTSHPVLSCVLRCSVQYVSR